MPNSDSTTSAPDINPATPPARTAFVRRVKETDPRFTVFGTPVLSCQYQPFFSGICLKDETGELLSHEEAAELIQEVQAFYAACRPEEVEEYNERAVNFRPCRSDASDDQRERKTESGYVYVLHAETGHYKIGRAKDANNRHRMIATKMPYPVRLAHTITCVDYIGVEAALHDRFQSQRVNGEWFMLDAADLRWLCSFDTMTVEEARQ